MSHCWFAVGRKLMCDPGIVEETHLYPVIFHVKIITIQCVVKQQFKLNVYSCRVKNCNIVTVRLKN